MSDIVRSIRAELNLGNKAIDCYLFPNGEKRIGIGGASIAIGRSKEYLGRLQKTESKAHKALTDIGYTGCTEETDVEIKRGATRSKTISIRDFTKLITWGCCSQQKSGLDYPVSCFCRNWIGRNFRQGFQTAVSRLSVGKNCSLYEMDYRGSSGCLKCKL